MGAALLGGDSAEQKSAPSTGAREVSTESTGSLCRSIGRKRLILELATARTAPGLEDEVQLLVRVPLYKNDSGSPDCGAQRWMEGAQLDDGTGRRDRTDRTLDLD
eukprot:Skav227248  [mRNA]  locus=scaffold2789:307442:308784:+ [translate_table: standard]